MCKRSCKIVLNVCMRSFSRRHRYTSQVYRLLSLHAHSLGLCKCLSSLLKPSHHLNTVIFTLLMIPQLFVINYRFQSENFINSKRILSLCEFLSHPEKTHFAVSKRAHKNYRHSFIFWKLCRKFNMEHLTAPFLTLI